MLFEAHGNSVEEWPGSERDLFGGTGLRLNGRWPVHPRSRFNEWHVSWLFRLACELGLSLQTVCRNFLDGPDCNSLLANPSALRRLAANLSIRTGTTAARVLEMADIYCDPTIAKFLYPPSQMGWQRLVQFCPLCLSEDKKPYIRWYWGFAWSLVCARHNVRLSHHCPKCRDVVFTLNPARTWEHVALCNACGADLRIASTLPASPLLIELQGCIDNAVQAGTTIIPSLGCVSKERLFELFDTAYKIVTIYHPQLSIAERLQKVPDFGDGPELRHLPPSRRPPYFEAVAQLLFRWPDSLRTCLPEPRSALLLRQVSRQKGRPRPSWDIHALIEKIAPELRLPRRSWVPYDKLGRTRRPPPQAIRSEVTIAKGPGRTRKAAQMPGGPLMDQKRIASLQRMAEARIKRDYWNFAWRDREALEKKIKSVARDMTVSRCAGTTVL